MGRRKEEEPRLRFKERDVVLAKVAGSPLWPSVIRQCEVDKNDPNYEFNGMFHRDPDWYWCSFFGSDGEDDEGMWVRSSKIKNFSLKAMPVAPENDDLAAAHESADKFYQKHHGDDDDSDEDVDEDLDADEDETKKTPNGVKADDDDEDDGEKTVGSGGAGKSPRDPGAGATSASVNKALDEEVANVTATRRSQRPRAQKTPASVSSTAQTNKRKRPANSGVAQKRPRRASIGNAAYKKPGDMNMTLEETRAQLWAARRTIQEQNEILKTIQGALSNWRPT